MDNIELYRSYTPDLEEFTATDLADRTRRPYFDVGEYLPELNDGEFEFVRISLASTTGDVIALRICRDGTKFIVNIVDEYQTEFTDYKCAFDSVPTQGEVFDILTTMSNDDGIQSYLIAIINENEFNSISQVTDFIQLDSKLYPNLYDLFVDYLVENELLKDDTSDESNLEFDDLDELSRLIENHRMKSDWDSLIGTLCFNVWHKTNRWYLNSNDIRYIDISFICALNLFQKWDKIYLSKKYSISDISKDASPFVIDQASELLDTLSKLKVFISTIRELGVGQQETSKHFISLFSSNLLNSSKFKEKAINPLDYFQTGLEILCLFAEFLRNKDARFFQELLQIGDLEPLVDSIVQDINSLSSHEE